jgi:hypothetical protein
MTIDKFALRRARRLLAEANTRFIELGRLLAAQRKNGNFRAFCENVPIHTRKAYVLISTAEAVDKGRITEAQVLKLGWTKAAMVVGLATKKQVQDAVKAAETMTATCLAASLKGDRRKLICKVFNLTQAESNELESALLKAGASVKAGRYKHRSEALMAIVRSCALSSNVPPVRLVA